MSYLEMALSVSRVRQSAEGLESARRSAMPRQEGVWHLESLDAEQRFGQPHAKLFPFIGRKVRTPQGPGTLLQAFAEAATVLLDSERDGACARFLPTEISPAVTEEAYA
jgi:hypothetical protein